MDRLSFSQNKAFQRTTEQKKALLRELRETLSSTTVRGLRETLPARIKALEAEIREEEAARSARSQAIEADRAARQRPRRDEVRRLAQATFARA